jgi:hypothetical protein
MMPLTGAARECRDSQKKTPHARRSIVALLKRIAGEDEPEQVTLRIN